MFRPSRRQFLQTSAALIAAPTIVPRSCFGANERISVACIGVKNQGGGNLDRFQKAGCDVVAICDVDSHVRADAMKKIQAKDRTCEQFDDFRRALDLKGVDAVVISTPDHWHAIMTILACQAGKDVYCEKPLSLTITEGRRMVTAARANNRVVQTGSMQRSGKEFHQACTLVRNGVIGKLQKILVGLPKANHPGPLGPDADPPANLDYDTWLGPAPQRPYNEKRVHYNFRFWWDYSGGQMTNWGAHHIDIAQWGHGTDDTGPIRVEGTAEFNRDKVHEVTEKCLITCTYADGVQLVIGQDQKEIPGGTTFIGEGGRLHVDRGKISSDPEGIVKTTDIEALPVKLIKAGDHTRNFLNCMRTRENPVADVEIGHRSATICHLANIVARLGRAVDWDPVNEAFKNDPEAQAMCDRNYRSPWTHLG